MIEHLTTVREDNRIAYRDADIRAHATEVHDLGQNGLLAVLIQDELWVSFAVFSFESGPSTVENDVIEGILWNRVFHGSGPTGVLRELRHTYWGEPDNSGYIFYPSATLITMAFEKLKTWFDCEI